MIKQTKSLQPQSQKGDVSLDRTHVPTPEIEVSLVDRMRRRFGTRDRSARVSDMSDASALEGETTASVRQKSTKAQTASSKRTASRKKTPKPSKLAEKVIRIDKFFSPDLSRTFRSPTRFPSKSGPRVPAAPAPAPTASVSGESDEGTSETPRATKSTRRRTKRSAHGENSDIENRNRPQDSHQEKSSDNDPTVGQEKSTLKRKDPSRASDSLKKRRSESRLHESTTSNGDEPAVHQEGGRGRSDEDDGGGTTGDVSREKEARTKNKGNVFMASGEVEAHMADKEFIGNQVRIMSTPFVLESGPRSWMQIWKGRQSSANEDLQEIPSSVINRIVTKINSHMDDVYQQWLGRQEQRNTLMSLDTLRKEAQEQDQTNLKPDLQNQLDLQTIVSSYPSEWPDSIAEDEKELAERYASHRARLFALSRSLAITKQQSQQYKSLVVALRRMDVNLEQCSSADFENEVKRTRDLVMEIKRRMQEMREDLSGEDGVPKDADKTGDNCKTTPPLPPSTHAALVRTLFRAAASAESF